jgi:hypothetical protein
MGTSVQQRTDERDGARKARRMQIFEYDALRHRVWILGQRCHHGATGTVLAAIACLGLIIEPPRVKPPTNPPAKSRSWLALAATGGALMAHDWKDHQFWFKRGRGPQA